MSTRISTSGMHAAAMSQIMQQQSALAKTQAQVASGKKFQTPAEDPIGAARVIDLERSRAELTQYGKNATMLTNRLTTGEQALQDAGTLLQRVREIAISANSGIMDDASLKSLATELRARSQELQDIGNRTDANGEYLFAGFSTGTQPFARTTAGIAYSGDQGTRSLQISASQKIADGISGVRAFMEIPEGNGTFTTAAGVHAGTGSIDTGQVTNAAAWVKGSYTITFTSPGAWTVTDAANVAVASGTYVDGGVVAFNGIQAKISGEPATGDTFTIAPAGKKSLFEAVDDIAAALEAGAGTPSARAQLNSNMSAALTQVDQGLDHVLTLRAEVGSRLSALDAAAGVRDDLDYELQSSLSEVRDLDYAEAVSRMNQQLVGLQAAQQAYSRIAQMSLFDYL
jgi:flagellar hook-associated protein 3 FlgL